MRASYWHWYEKSFSLWHSGSPSLESQSDGPLSPSDIHPSSNLKHLMLSGVSLLAVSNVNNPVGLVGLPYVMWSAHFFVTHIQTEKISSWNGPTVHVCCFMLARTSTKTFVSRVRKTAKKIFVSRKNRHSLSEVSLYLCCSNSCRKSYACRNSTKTSESAMQVKPCYTS